MAKTDPTLDQVIRQSSGRRSGGVIVIKTEDVDFIALAIRAMGRGGDIAFIHDASTFDALVQPIDVAGKVIAVH